VPLLPDPVGGLATRPADITITTTAANVVASGTINRIGFVRLFMTQLLLLDEDQLNL
jgi:hypothetical protein